MYIGVGLNILQNKVVCYYKATLGYIASMDSVCICLVCTCVCVRVRVRVHVRIRMCVCMYHDVGP